MDVLKYAMKMEVDGKQLYEKLAAENDNEGLKTIFLRLAEDEQKHYDFFAQLKDGSDVSLKDSTALNHAQNVFADLLKNREKVPEVEGDLEGYHFAMKLEAESINLYEKAAEREKNSEVKRQLLRIADEERKHFNILENLYDFTNAPNQYLAWREFTNLGEFHQFGRDVDLTP